MTITEAIRERFPQPVSTIQQHPDQPRSRYCVGGALCLWLDGWRAVCFPAHRVIADALQRANPALAPGDAERFASLIVDNNDAERFDEAWTALGIALEGIPPMTGESVPARSRSADVAES